MANFVADEDVHHIIVRCFRNFGELSEKKFKLVYYSSWTPGSIEIEDQLLLTLMKLTMNCKDADLAVRFNVSETTVSNIVNTLISALY